jgi:hypothetical protein
MKHKLSIAVGTLLLSVSAACSSSQPLTPDTVVNLTKIQGIELFMSRAHLSDTEFEQYKLGEGTLFSECGSIRRGRFLPQSHEITRLSAEQLKSLHTLAGSIQKKPSKNQLEAPGDNSWLADPGQFSLLIESEAGAQKINASLDSISSASTTHERELKAIASEMRQLAGGSPCGNNTFFGLR